MNARETIEKYIEVFPGGSLFEVTDFHEGCNVEFTRSTLNAAAMKLVKEGKLIDEGKDENHGRHLWRKPWE